MESSVMSRSLTARSTTHQTAYGVWATLFWVALVLAPSLKGQVAPRLKYKVVKASKPHQQIATINTLANQGYRVLVWGPKIIMQLEAKPPDTYRYMAMNTDAGPDWLNSQGAHGYRLTDGDVLEKAPDPRNYEYVIVGGAGDTKKLPEVSDLIKQGYHPVGLTMFMMGFIFERELRLNSKPSGTTGGGEIQIADAMRTSKVFKQITVLAAKGYRYLGPHMSQKGGGRAVLMLKCGQPCGGPFEYRSFDVHNIVQLTKSLNEQGKDGFRVVRNSLWVPPHVVERGAARKETYSYHVLPAKHAEALEQALNAPEENGYEPIGYGWRVGWTAEGFLILEKVLTASGPSQQPARERSPSK